MLVKKLFFVGKLLLLVGGSNKDLVNGVFFLLYGLGRRWVEGVAGTRNRKRDRFTGGGEGAVKRTWRAKAEVNLWF